tara:strand:- start:1018 stop:1998 length:981 start_codon:yes stop_codon:yes gene_type:complete
MSNDLIFEKQTTAPVKRAGALSPLARKLVSGSSNRRIQTTTNGTFKRLVNGEQIGKAKRGDMNVIIIGALPKVSRIYYHDKYDPDAEAKLPNCWSNLGDKPEASVPDAQASNCVTCPMNVKGSGDKGGRACRYQRRISLILEGDPSGDIYQFNIPSKSLFGKGSGNTHPFEAYIKYLVANNESPDNVVTKVAYDDEAESMELLFTPVRNITDAEYETVTHAQEQPEATQYTVITVGQADGVSKKPEPTEKPVVERSDEPDDDEDEVPAAKEETVEGDFFGKDDSPEEEKEEEPAPKKRASKKKSAKEEPTVLPADIASVIDEWGDD